MGEEGGGNGQEALPGPEGRGGGGGGGGSGVGSSYQREERDGQPMAVDRMWLATCRNESEPHAVTGPGD